MSYCFTREKWYWLERFFCLCGKRKKIGNSLKKPVKHYEAGEWMTRILMAYHSMPFSKLREQKTRIKPFFMGVGFF